jgi:acid phosphatase family membrane protein YuiD
LAVVTALTYFVSVPTGLAGPRTTVAVVFLVVAAGAVALRETVAREWT